MNLLITGCYGFIGYNFINYINDNFKNDFNLYGIDSLESSCSVANQKISNIENFNFTELNIVDINKSEAFNDVSFDYVINFAAETHVDNSIFMPEKFIYSNVLGVTEVLKFAINKMIPKVLHVSTDEVYGSSREEYFKEDAFFKPSSPYSASKASAELVCEAFHKTYGMEILLVRPANNYGIYQQPEKLIPFSLANLFNERNIEVYGEGKNIRHWLHVTDTSSAIMKIMESKESYSAFNIGSDVYMENIDVVKKILSILNLNEERITFVEDRPGHDFRYAVDFSKLKKLGWEPLADFDYELEKITDWYKNNIDWWKSEYESVLKKRELRKGLS